MIDTALAPLTDHIRPLSLRDKTLIHHEIKEREGDREVGSFNKYIKRGGTKWGNCQWATHLFTICIFCEMGYSKPKSET